ncbi:Response regulator transcription factor OS=Streptomyces rimosus subsp. rimosus (strain ATCC / DSM 40260 / JCM 4667 / NRRL 2234) OX=1265868 GN=SRIM_031560 PE=4 SV=1 [Streptomyces rimosus subsp. rimosus]
MSPRGVMAKLELDSRLAACLASYAFAVHSCTGRCPGMLAASHS